MSNPITQSEFIKRANIKHNNFYGYNKSIYINDNTKCCITCPKHGDFWQRAGCHIRVGHGCPKCKAELTSKTLLNESYFLNKLKKIHGNKYSVLETYRGAAKKIKFKCNKHNIEFLTCPSTIYRIDVFPCPECSKENNVYSRESIKWQNNFIKKSNIIHNKYDYSKVVYKGIHKKVTIICPIHGEFLQTPSDHLYGKCGCPICKMPRGEARIGIYLNNKKINHIYQYRVKIENSYHWFDFYLPEYNLIISFNGNQHYAPVKFFGGNKGFKMLQERDIIKNQYCNKNTIKHLIISYNQMNDIENILDNTLNNKKKNI